MKLSAWLQYLETLHPVSIDMGLDRTRAVADRLGLDLSKKSVLSVAGTNGKGSTSAFLEKLLLAANCSIGLYRSPHLLQYNERVCINGNPVSDEALCDVFARIETARADISLTYFEFGTLAALLIFAESPVDYLLLEVGLGGRLDAVNIVDADIAIITNIALDHMQWLGDSREQIGREKAGIMRSGKALLYGEEDMPASIRQEVETLSTALYQFKHEFNVDVQGKLWRWQGQDSAGQSTTLAFPSEPHSLLQRFPANAALALQAFMLLGIKLAPAVIAEALSTASLPGRFQVLHRRYTMILDVAHNPHAMQQTLKNLQDCFPGRKVSVLIAMLKDKDHQQVLDVLRPLVTNWHLAELLNSRGAAAKILYNALRKSGQDRVFTYASVEQAFKSTEQSLGADDILLVTGSFYTVAAVLELL